MALLASLLLVAPVERSARGGTTDLPFYGRCLASRESSRRAQSSTERCDVGFRDSAMAGLHLQLLLFLFPMCRFPCFQSNKGPFCSLNIAADFSSPCDKVLYNAASVDERHDVRFAISALFG